MKIQMETQDSRIYNSWFFDSGDYSGEQMMIEIMNQRHLQSSRHDWHNQNSMVQRTEIVSRIAHPKNKHVCNACFFITTFFLEVQFFRIFSSCCRSRVCFTVKLIKIFASTHYNNLSFFTLSLSLSLCIRSQKQFSEMILHFLDFASLRGRIWKNFWQEETINDQLFCSLSPNNICFFEFPFPRITVISVPRVEYKAVLIIHWKRAFSVIPFLSRIPKE